MSDEDNKPTVIDVATSDIVVAPSSVDPRDLLTDEERAELKKYETTVLAADPRRTLAAVTATKFYALYLQGYSTKEIQELNPSFPLGMIIHARIKYNWDDAQDKHVKDLMDRVRDKVLLTQLESAHYLTDVLTAIHKLNGTKIKKFIQTGDEAELKGLHISTLMNYAKTFELIVKLTGQDRDKKVPSAPIQVLLSPGAVAATPTALPAPSGRIEKAISADDAAKVMKALLTIKKVREDGKKNE